MNYNEIEKLDLTPLDLAILNTLLKKKPTFSEDVVDNKVLCAKFNITSRAVFYSISRLRKYYAICSDKTLKGYWLGSVQEITTTINQLLNSAETIRETVRNLTNLLVEKLEEENADMLV